MERELIIERTRAELDVARQLGRKGGRKPKITESKIEFAKKLLASGVAAKDVAKNLSVSVPTLYHWGGLPRHTVSVQLSVCGGNTPTLWSLTQEEIPTTTCLRA